MGNDGGSFSQRAEMVKLKKREEKKERHMLAKQKARLCAISKEPLVKPVVVCRLGRLYNKEPVLKHLLEKTMPHVFNHIRKLKDVKVANLESSLEKDNGLTIMCPVS